MKKIPLTQKYHALVDDEDYPYISRFVWKISDYISNPLRAERAFRIGDQTLTICMEQFIVAIPTGHKVMHKNGNTLDNRKENLLVGDTGQKSHHAKKMGSKNGRKYSSVYKGVCWSKNKKVWRAYISDPRLKGVIGSKRQIKLGSFKDEKDAAIAYNEKALELYGEFAYQNKIT